MTREACNIINVFLDPEDFQFFRCEAVDPLLALAARLLFLKYQPIIHPDRIRVTREVLRVRSDTPSLYKSAVALLADPPAPLAEIEAEFKKAKRRIS